MRYDRNYYGELGCCLTCTEREQNYEVENWNGIESQGCLCTSCKCTKCSKYDRHSRSCIIATNKKYVNELKQEAVFPLVDIEAETKKAVYGRVVIGKKKSPERYWFARSTICEFSDYADKPENWVLVEKGIIDIEIVNGEPYVTCSFSDTSLCYREMQERTRRFMSDKKPLERYMNTGR